MIEVYTYNYQKKDKQLTNNKINKTQKNKK